MSRYFEADIDDDDYNLMTLADGRVAIAFDSVDHRAMPQEVAACILNLEQKRDDSQELVEVVIGDDRIWWAIVPVAS